MSYLEEYLEKIQYLPIDVNRNLRLIRELDEKVQDIQQSLDQKQNIYLNNMRSVKDKKTENKKPENRLLLEEIQKQQNELLALSKEKISISNQIYERVDDWIEKLDVDLKKYESEIKLNKEELVDIKEEQQNDSVTGFNNKKKKKYDSKMLNRYKMKSKSEKNHLNNVVEQVNEAIMYDEPPINEMEPLYCYCNRVSFGQMVACDNNFCEKEWFHFECVGISTLPKGKWYCRDCLPLKKKNPLIF